VRLATCGPPPTFHRCGLAFCNNNCTHTPQLSTGPVGHGLWFGGSSWATARVHAHSIAASPLHGHYLTPRIRVCLHGFTGVQTGSRPCGSMGTGSLALRPVMPCLCPPPLSHSFPCPGTGRFPSGILFLLAFNASGLNSATTPPHPPRYAGASTTYHYLPHPTAVLATFPSMPYGTSPRHTRPPRCPDGRACAWRRFRQWWMQWDRPSEHRELGCGTRIQMAVTKHLSQGPHSHLPLLLPTPAPLPCPLSSCPTSSPRALHRHPSDCRASAF